MNRFDLLLAEGTILRTSGRYALVLFDRLPPEEQALLRDLRAQDGFYGVLRPREGGAGTLKAINRDTALLLFTLQTSGPLPSFARGSARLGGQLAELILDGILEVKANDRFISGPDALSLLEGEGADGPGGAVARLSVQALRYAEALDIGEAELLSARLYMYNRLPITSSWRRSLPDAPAVLRYLAAGSGISALKRIERAYRLGEEENGARRQWLSWSRRQSGTTERTPRTSFKLYVSPSMESCGPVFCEFVEVLDSRRVRNFKIGADAAGLLRPDKFVAYFNDFESLAAAAADLTERISGAAPQGVPFSAEISGNGLLSWGMDPPRSEQPLAWQNGQSWRLWVTNRLAAALLAAKSQAASAVPPWRFAMERLRFEGVDVDNWTPNNSIWAERGAAR